MLCSIGALLLLMRAVNKMPTEGDNKEKNSNSKTPNKFYVLFLIIVFIIGYVFINLKECSHMNYDGDSIEETIRHGD